jgi:hypothetical protein
LVLTEYSVEKSFELDYILERYRCPFNPNQSLFPEAGQETRDRLAGNPAQLTYLLLCQVHAQSLVVLRRLALAAGPLKKQTDQLGLGRGRKYNASYLLIRAMEILGYVHSHSLADFFMCSHEADKVGPEK